MICPFRVKVEFEYIKVPEKEDDPSFLEKSQTQVYPPCVEDECPFYDDYYEKCTRLSE